MLLAAPGLVHVWRYAVAGIATELRSVMMPSPVVVVGAPSSHLSRYQPPITIATWIAAMKVAAALIIGRLSPCFSSA